MGALADDPFEHQVTQDGRVRVFRGGRLVVTVAGRAAERLVSRLGASPEADQQALARATGAYRMGTERRAGRQGRGEGKGA